MFSSRPGTESPHGLLAVQGAQPAACAASGAAAVTLLVASSLPLPPLSRHMALHIVLMSVVGPLLALALFRKFEDLARGRWRLALPSLVQLAVLWAWHIPAALATAHQSHAAQVSMHATLLASAVWFWTAVIAQARSERWRAVAALLITGKVFCLLGALLTFAPRELFLIPALHGPEHGTSLGDQQLAGLLMLAACPATYILAGVALTVRWLDDLARDER